eukprot:jgi/Bigna1/70890/fgenesh1_pg.13_\
MLARTVETLAGFLLFAGMFVGVNGTMSGHPVSGRFRILPKESSKIPGIEHIKLHILDNRLLDSEAMHGRGEKGKAHWDSIADEILLDRDVKEMWVQSFSVPIVASECLSLSIVRRLEAAKQDPLVHQVIINVTDDQPSSPSSMSTGDSAKAKIKELYEDIESSVADAQKLVQQVEVARHAAFVSLEEGPINSTSLPRGIRGSTNPPSHPQHKLHSVHKQLPEDSPPETVEEVVSRVANSVTPASSSPPAPAPASLPAEEVAEEAAEEVQEAVIPEEVAEGAGEVVASSPPPASPPATTTSPVAGVAASATPPSAPPASSPEVLAAATVASPPPPPVSTPAAIVAAPAATASSPPPASTAAAVVRAPAHRPFPPRGAASAASPPPPPASTPAAVVTAPMNSSLPPPPASTPAGVVAAPAPLPSPPATSPVAVVAASAASPPPPPASTPTAVVTAPTNSSPPPPPASTPAAAAVVAASSPPPPASAPAAVVSTPATASSPPPPTNPPVEREAAPTTTASSLTPLASIPATTAATPATASLPTGHPGTNLGETYTALSHPPLQKILTRENALSYNITAATPIGSTLASINDLDLRVQMLEGSLGKLTKKLRRLSSIGGDDDDDEESSEGKKCCKCCNAKCCNGVDSITKEKKCCSSSSSVVDSTSGGNPSSVSSPAATNTGGLGALTPTTKKSAAEMLGDSSSSAAALPPLKPSASSASVSPVMASSSIPPGAAAQPGVVPATASSPPPPTNPPVEREAAPTTTASSLPPLASIPATTAATAPGAEVAVPGAEVAVPAEKVAVPATTMEAPEATTMAAVPGGNGPLLANTRKAGESAVVTGKNPVKVSSPASSFLGTSSPVPSPANGGEAATPTPPKQPLSNGFPPPFMPGPVIRTSECWYVDGQLGKEDISPSPSGDAAGVGAVPSSPLPSSSSSAVSSPPLPAPTLTSKAATATANPQLPAAKTHFEAAKLAKITHKKVDHPGHLDHLSPLQEVDPIDAPCPKPAPFITVMKGYEASLIGPDVFGEDAFELYSDRKYKITGEDFDKFKSEAPAKLTYAIKSKHLSYRKGPFVNLTIPTSGYIFAWNDQFPETPQQRAPKGWELYGVGNTELGEGAIFMTHVDLGTYTLEQNSMRHATVYFVVLDSDDRSGCGCTCAEKQIRILAAGGTLDDGEVQQKGSSSLAHHHSSSHASNNSMRLMTAQKRQHVCGVKMCTNPNYNRTAAAHRSFHRQKIAFASSSSSSSSKQAFSHPNNVAATAAAASVAIPKASRAASSTDMNPEEQLRLVNEEIFQDFDPPGQDD